MDTTRIWPTMKGTPIVSDFKQKAQTESYSISPKEFDDIRRRVASVLLQYVDLDETRRSGLSQSEIAMILGTSRTMVNSALKSLQAEGAIRIDRHRLYINKKELEQIAAETVQTFFSLPGNY